MVAPLRLVFFGTPEFAVPTLQQLLRSRHTVVGVVTQPDKGRGRGRLVTPSPVKALAMAHELPVLQPASLRAPELESALKDLGPDLGVVAAYGRLIPDALLALPPRGMINVHASLLPRYRGAAPVHRAVMAGEPETGVTIMRLVHDLDAGGMLAKATREIEPDETSVEVERDLAVMGATLLVSVVEEIAAGTATEQPQDDSQATYAPRLVKEDGLVDWTRTAQQIHNQVRGLHPWPHAYTTIARARTIILRTSLPNRTAQGQAGTVVHLSREGIHVAAGDGRVLAIQQLKPEGRRAMSAPEFLAGHSLSVGAVLGGP